jgi:hypothetical protein
MHGAILAITGIDKCDASLAERVQSATRYLDGPIAVRLAALTAALEAACACVASATVAGDDETVVRDVIRVCARVCRDPAPSVARLARGGLFRLLRGFVELDCAPANGLATLTLKAIVFARIESECSDDRDATCAHVKSECARTFDCARRRGRSWEEEVYQTLRLVADDQLREAARTLRPPEKMSDAIVALPIAPHKVVVENKVRKQRRNEIELARSRRLKADARAEEGRRRAMEDAERREASFKRRAAKARTTYLNSPTRINK